MSKSIISLILATLIIISCKNDSNVIDLIKAKNEGFQIFEDENFIIKCPVVLEIDRKIDDSNLSNNDKEREYVDIVGRYKFDSGTPVVYTILVDKSIRNYCSNKKELILVLENKYLRDFISSLNKRKIKYTKEKIDNKECYKYIYNLESTPVMVLFIINNGFSYLIQVSSNVDLEGKFNDFIRTFKLIK